MTHEDEQRRFFERLAARYDGRFLRARWPRNQELKAIVIEDALEDVFALGPVAEIGCGTAQIAERLLELNPQFDYTGLDLSPSMLGIARRRLERFHGRVELRAVEGGLCLEHGRYAAAYGVDVLHHMADPVRVLRELREALRPGAPVVFLEANPRFPITTMIGLLQKEERNVLKIGFRNLRSWFDSAGFTTVEVSYGPLYTPPGPPTLVPTLDRIDAALARTPILRTLSIFLVARGVAPPAART